MHAGTNVLKIVHGSSNFCKNQHVLYFLNILEPPAFRNSTCWVMQKLVDMEVDKVANAVWHRVNDGKSVLCYQDILNCRCQLRRRLKTLACVFGSHFLSYFCHDGADPKANGSCKIYLFIFFITYQTIFLVQLSQKKQITILSDSDGLQSLKCFASSLHPWQHSCLGRM